MLRSCVLSFAVLAPAIVSSAEPVRLEVERAWDLAERLPEAYRAYRSWSFVARRSKLYFLLSNRSGSHAIVITSPDGDIERVVENLPGRLNSGRLDVDQSGKIYVTQANRDGEGRFERLVRLDESGREEMEWVARPGFLAWANFGERIAAHISPNLIQVLGPGGRVDRLLTTGGRRDS